MTRRRRRCRAQRCGGTSQPRSGEGERSGAHDPAPTTMQSAAMRRSGAHDPAPTTMQSAAMWGHLPTAKRPGGEERRA